MHDTRVIIAAVLIIVLTLGLAIGGSWYVGLRAGEQGARNATRISQLCESGNQGSAQIVSFAEYLVAVSSVSPPPGETAAEKARRLHLSAVFIAHVRKEFAPRNCHAPAGGKR